MRDRELYQQILGLSSPWKVVDIRLSLADRQVVIVVARESEVPLSCPSCGAACGVYDHRKRSWRHLDTCQLQTVIEAEVPRVDCPTHGVQQVSVSWAEPGGRFTALFEAMVIAWLGEAPIKAVAELVGLSWDQVDGIQQRAIERGLARRKPAAVTNLGIDETSYQHDHEYVSVITDRDRRVVLEVLEDRKKETVLAWLDTLSAQQKQAITTVSMDMWEAFINAFLERIPDASRKICFDRFHIASYFGKAVDAVRIDEHKALRANGGQSILTHTKHQWLRNSQRTDNRSRTWFMALTRASLKTARAWAIKEQAGKLWNFTSRTWAEKGWRQLLSWMDRCRLVPVKKVAATIKAHLWGILNAVVTSSTNAIGESLNARIQKIKAMACGFRNRQRFRRAILFHLGGLSLMPTGASYPTHTKA
jgi:transposase